MMSDQSAGTGSASSGVRFDSWKQIASYLHTSVRTVQRWEKTEGLPVRRHEHARQDTVYAFKDEVDRWREGRERKPSTSETAWEAELKSCARCSGSCAAVCCRRFQRARPAHGRPGSRVGTVAGEPAHRFRRSHPARVPCR